MHRTTLCLRTNRHPRLLRIFHDINLRRDSNAGAVYQVDDDGNVIETLSSWEDHHAREVGRRPVAAQDVVIDDLSATLEAHRASNRASVIRKIDAPSSIPSFFLRPSIDGKRGIKGVPSEVPREDLDEGRALAQHIFKSRVDGDQAEETQSAHEAGIRKWPADSLQAQEGHGKRVRRKASNDFVKSSGVLEYIGVPFLPTQSWDYVSSSTARLQRPWLAYLEGNSGDHFERLSSEIRAYEAYMRLTPVEEAAAQLIMSDVNNITRKSLQNAPIKLLGSRSTGLATPLSDFDVTFSVTSSDHSPSDRKQNLFSRSVIRQAVGSMREMEKHLRRSIKVQDTEFVMARVPIIETKHRGTGLKIQIQTMAPHQPSQEYSAAYLNELPSLRPLYMVLRYCLEIRGLTKVYEGGLGSYSLLMMIVTALKHSGGTFASDDLAGQLLYVLYFYGSTDLYRYGFSANPPRIFDKLKEGWSMSKRLAHSQDPQLQGIDKLVRERNRRKPYLLSLQDPANDINDLGKNSYAIKHIQAVFNNARQSMLSALEQATAPPEDYGKDGSRSYMDDLVRADYKAFEANRSKVERFVKDPVSKDYDYSTERITEDFERRVNVYKGLVTEDFQRSVHAEEEPITGEEYGADSTLPTLQAGHLKRQVKSSMRHVAGSSLASDRWSTSFMVLYLHFESNAAILSLWVEWRTVMNRLAQNMALDLQSVRMPDGLSPNQDKWTTEYLDLLMRGLIPRRTLWSKRYGIKEILAQFSASTGESPTIRKRYPDDMISLVHRHLSAYKDHLWNEWNGFRTRLARVSASSETLPLILRHYSSDIELHVRQHLPSIEYQLREEFVGINRRLALVSPSSKTIPVIRRLHSSDIELHVRQHLPTVEYQLGEELVGINRRLALVSASSKTIPVIRRLHSSDTELYIRQHLLSVEYQLRKEFVGINQRLALVSPSSKIMPMIRRLNSSDRELYVRQPLPALAPHLWIERYGIKKQLAKAERSYLPTNSEAQATPAHMGNSNPRRLGREITTAEIAKAQDAKHIARNTTDLGRRFQVLRAKMGTPHFIKDVASVRKKDTDLASTWLWYVRMRCVKDRLSREFKDISRRLNILDGHESAMTDTVDRRGLEVDRHQLKTRQHEGELELRELRWGDKTLKQGSLSLGNLTDAECSPAVAKFKELQRRRRELASELNNIAKQLNVNRRLRRLRLLEVQQRPTIQAESRVDLFQSILASKEISQIRPPTQNERKKPLDNVSRILDDYSMTTPEEDIEPPWRGALPPLTEAQLKYRRSISLGKPNG